MFYAFFAILSLITLLLPSVGHSLAICGQTISIQTNGRGECVPPGGGSGGWQGIFQATKQNMIQAAQGNQAVVSQLQGARLNVVAGQCSRAKMFVSGGSTVTVRCGGDGAPSSYAITMVHELCHVASHAAGDKYLSSFSSINCSGVSPYARCGSKNEMFAEACTAYLNAPARLQRGCTDAAKAQQFFQEMFPGKGGNKCANFNHANPQTSGPQAGQPSEGTVPPMTPQQMQQKEEAREKYGCQDSHEAGNSEPTSESDECKAIEKKDAEDIYDVCKSPGHIYYRHDFCQRLLDPNQDSGLRAAPASGLIDQAPANNPNTSNKSAIAPQQSESGGSASLPTETLQDLGAKETLNRGTMKPEEEFKKSAIGDPILSEKSESSEVTAADIENYWEEFAASADDVEAQKLAEQEALEASGLLRTAGASDSAKRSPAKKKLTGPDYQGMTLKAVDGITGPLGRSLWIKVHQQYNEVRTVWEKEDQYLRDNFDGHL